MAVINNYNDITHLIYDANLYIVIFSALQLDVFDLIWNSPGRSLSSRALTQHTQASGIGTRNLLDILVSSRILKKQKDLFQLSPLAESFFVKSSKTFVGRKFGLFNSAAATPQASEPATSQLASIVQPLSQRMLMSLKFPYSSFALEDRNFEVHWNYAANKFANTLAHQTVDILGEAIQ